MTDEASCPTAAGVEAAIKDAARKAAAADPSLSVNQRISLEYFNRFLSRVFSEGDDSDWILKGGMGILARVPSTRTTRDVDLYRQQHTLAQALDDLNRLAAIDLGDHFRFEYASHTSSIDDNTQPYTDGCRVTFAIYIGLSARGALQVDLAVGAGVTGAITTTSPAGALDLPRLTTHRYRLYPAVDQIADKVCATMTTYGKRPSSREKDLVDLVVFATTHDIDGSALRRAIATEARRRQLDLPAHFAVPASWGAGYGKLSNSVPYCAGYRTVDLASALVRRLIEPALGSDADGRAWSHVHLAWS